MFSEDDHYYFSIPTGNLKILKKITREKKYSMFFSNQIKCDIKDKKELLPYLGKRLIIKINSKIIDKKSLPVTIQFGDSITKNYQIDVYNLKDYDEEIIEENYGYLFLRTKNKLPEDYWATFDFDGTLLKSSCMINQKGNFHIPRLKDSRVIVKENLTTLGIYVMESGIPCKLITSRREYPKNQYKHGTVRDAIKELFPNMDITFGSQIKEIGKARDIAKVKDKISRLDIGCLHFDDEEIVVEWINKFPYNLAILVY